MVEINGIPQILMVDDNQEIREVVNILLSGEGYQVDEASNGPEALASIQAKEYDLVILDVMMPNMNGYDATRAIRNLGREDAKTVPIIAMTANAFAEDVKDALDAGMDAHIAKPIDMGLLKKTVSQYVQGKE